MHKRLYSVVLGALFTILVSCNVVAQHVGDLVVLQSDTSTLGVPVHPAPGDRHYTRWANGTIATVTAIDPDTGWFEVDDHGLTGWVIKDYLTVTTQQPSNNPPIISNIPDQTINEGSSTGAIPFTVRDMDTPVASLTLQATSSNQTLVPNGNITIGGSGANRMVTVAPLSDQSGSAAITVTVSDGIATASDQFTVTVVAGTNPAVDLISYYQPAQGKTGVALRAALHAIIRGHTVVPYSSSTRTDTAAVLKILDQDPVDTNNVILIYSDRFEAVTTFGTTAGWSREHLWANSYGIDSVEPAYSDLFNLRPVDATVNSSRGNKYFDVSDPTDANYRQPAHLEAPETSTDSDSWEPPDQVKGDIARALFYMDVRYEGDATNEPDLVLTDKVASITSNGSFMGRLKTLLAWHRSDPVDAVEQTRNQRIFESYQHNRNPFVDHPEWVAAAFIPPLTITHTGTNVWLCWTNDCAPSMMVEESKNIASGWMLISNAPPVTGTNTCSVTVPLQPGTRFYRLRLK